MFDTTSVFDVMAVEDQDRRLASRQALALAQTRLDASVGAFLRAAVTKEQFDARMAGVTDEFALHVAHACSETGCDKPEHVARVLAEHYERNRRWQPKGAAGVDAQEEKEEDPGEMQDSNDGKGVLEPHQDDEDSDAKEIKWSKEHWIQDAVKRPGQLHRDLGVPQGEKIPESKLEEAEHSSDPKERERAQFAENVKGLGKGKKGGVQEMRRYLAAKTATEGITDLGGPEPEINKSLWTPENLSDPDVNDGRWPTVRKDVAEPIGPPNNEHTLAEIGEKFTEHQTLPNNSGDAGFDAGGPGPAPHTDTFGKGDQAAPVTHETQPE